MAGESARELARRQREKAARLNASADRYERGAEGESVTARALEELRARGWVIFHDVHWPGRQRANIDHVAVGPAGVFVIDSKLWAGEIRVLDGVLWQGDRRRETAVAATAEAGHDVSRMLQGFGAVPVLCFVRPEPVAEWAGEVMVCSTGNIADWLLSLPPLLGPQSIERTLTILSSGLVPAVARSVPHPVAGPRPPARRQRRAGRTSARPGLRRTERTTLFQGLVIAGAMAALGVWALPKLTANTPELLGLHPVRAEFGQVVDLHGSSDRPTMQLTASAPVSIPADRARPVLKGGQRLVAVRVHIANVSAMTWTSPHLAVNAHDSAGEVLPPVELRPIKRGPLLPPVARLTPDGSVDGYVAFALPRRARMTEFSLAVGPSSYETVRWTLQR